MRTSGHRHGETRHLRCSQKLPMGHPALLGEDVELFSDRMEDAVEYDTIIKYFCLLHDAEIAADDYA